MLIGASPRPGSIGRVVARNLLAGDLKHGLYFVNPRHSEIEGHKCYAKISDLPEVPTLGIIATPPATIPGIVSELAAKGTRAGVVITAGLSADIKQQMLDASRPSLFRILGPNGIGLMLPHLGLNATFAHRGASAGRLALVSQSGALVTGMLDWAAARGIGFSHVISVGDMADVDFGDLLDYLAGDIKSRAILLYVEAITNAPKFMSAARRAASVKPVIVIKSGRHAAAAKAAASHTGRLAGADDVYDAAFRRAGLLRVFDLDELFDAAETLAFVPRLSGERLTIVTNGGGAGVLAADRLADFGGQLAELTSSTRAALSAALPSTWSGANPVDIIGDADPARYARILDILFGDPTTEAVLVIHCPTALTPPQLVAEQLLSSIKSHGQTSVPVLTNWLGDEAAESSRKLFSANGLPTYETPGAAARGFMHLVRHTRMQGALMRTPPRMIEDQTFASGPARLIIKQALADDRAMLTEAEAKEILKLYSIPIVPTEIATTPVEAGIIAERLIGSGHGSVALKILSKDISHKSDVDGVRLDLGCASAVRLSAEEMLTRITKLNPSARIDGFTVSPMIKRPRAQELIIGMSVDPTFGPMIMFGAGGISVEVVRDTALALPPLDMQMARDLISQTRVSRLLAGFRNRPAADLDAIAAALVAVSAMIAELPEIREIDINPLLADETGIIALDARMRIADPSIEPCTPMSIQPYPAHWEKRLLLDNIGGLVLRPIRPEDELLYADLLNSVSPVDHRLRFFAPKTKLSHKFVARLTQIDYAREMAFVAIEIDTGRLLGIARFIADPDFVRGEYAILVRSDLKGHGLGWQLMRHLMDYARAKGLQELFGSVIAENSTMLGMCKELGFTCRTDSDDASVQLVTLTL